MLHRYENPDNKNPLGWHNTMKNIKKASDLDWAKRAPGNYRPTAMERPGFIKPGNSVERPGFLQGWQESGAGISLVVLFILLYWLRTK